MNGNGIILHEMPLVSAASRSCGGSGGGGGTEARSRRFLPRYFNVIATGYYLLIIIASFVLALYVTCFRPRLRLAGGGAAVSAETTWWRTALFALIFVVVFVEVIKAALWAAWTELRLAFAPSGGGQWATAGHLAELYPSVEKVEVDDFFYKTNERGVCLWSCDLSRAPAST